MTYNRKKILLECISAILCQTYAVKAITIVNNASTDGTEELLKQKGILNNPKVNYISLNENLGGAGGFYEGLARTQNLGYDWVWIMDDDVIPEVNSLQELIKSYLLLKNSSQFTKKVSFLASTVYGEENEAMNVPTLDTSYEKNGYPGWHRVLQNGMVQIIKATFVSLLISYKAIDKVGLPCKDYFIWGDDSEYTQRLTKYYGPAFLVGKSKVIHKRKNAKSLCIFNFTDSQRIKWIWRLYRNNLINTMYYKGKLAGIKSSLNSSKTLLKCINKNHGVLLIGQIIKGIFLGFVQFNRFKNYIDSQLQ